MATQAIVINYTPTTSIHSIMSRLRDLMQYAFTEGVVWTDNPSSITQFVGRTYTRGVVSADERMVVRIRYSANTMYLQTAESVDTGTGVLSVPSYSEASWPVYLGEYGLLWAAADKGFFWMAQKSQYGTTNVLCATGFERLAIDTLDLQTTPYKTTRFGTLSGNLLHLPRLPTWASTSYSTAYLTPMGDGDSSAKPYFLAPDATGRRMFASDAVTRTAVVTASQREILPLRASRQGSPGGVGACHPLTGGDAPTTFHFGSLLSADQVAGTPALESVLPSITSPTHIALPGYTLNVGCYAVSRWATPTVFNL